MKVCKVKWPKWMDEYPLEFWDDQKVQEYVKMAHEYLVTMEGKRLKHQEYKDLVGKLHGVRDT